MGIITAIEQQKRRSKRQSVFVDGEFCVGAHEDVISTLGLFVGQHFDNETLAELVREETFIKAKEAAFRFIAYRNRSRQEIVKKLSGGDFPEDVVEEIMAELERIGLVDDKKFSEEYVEGRKAAKPMGKIRLSWELRRRGVGQDNIENALGSLDEQTEFEMALEIARRRVVKSDREADSLKASLSSLLMRRGFGSDVIRRVFDELFD